jgi:hypothetical protein
VYKNEEAEISVKIYYTNFTNKDSVIYHINTNDNYRKSTPYKMDEILEHVKDKYPDVGLIAKQDFIKKVGFGVHYNNAEGTNNYEHSDVLIKPNYYTGNIEAYVEDYKKYYMDFDRPKITEHTDDLYRWVQIHMGAKCEWWIDWRNEAINYDGMHRNRALWSNKSIIVFGDVPKRCYNEFTVIDVNPITNSVLPDRFTSDDLEAVMLSLIEETKKRIKDAEIAEQKYIEEKLQEIQEQHEHEYEKGLEEPYNEPPEEPDPEDMDIPEFPDEPEPEEPEAIEIPDDIIKDEEITE